MQSTIAKRSLLTIFFALTLHACSSSLYVSQHKDFDAPDQVLWHAASHSWYVSNLGGGISIEKDGYGWISKLNADGHVINSKWIDGLHAPTGMIATEDKLYVCDRDGIVQIDVTSASIDQVYLMPEAEFINDIAIANNGDLFVSDFFGNAIYRLPADTRKPELFVQINNSPDGLYIDGNTLIIVTWGKDVNRKTFTTSQLGTVLTVDLNNKAIQPYSEFIGQIGNLEGITQSSQGDYYITDWMNGKLLKVTPNGVSTILSGLKNPTDPDYSKELNVVAFPEHTNNQVNFYTLD